MEASIAYMEASTPSTEAFIASVEASVEASMEVLIDASVEASVEVTPTEVFVAASTDDTSTEASVKASTEVTSTKASTEALFSKCNFSSREAFTKALTTAFVAENLFSRSFHGSSNGSFRGTKIASAEALTKALTEAFVDVNLLYGTFHGIFHGSFRGSKQYIKIYIVIFFRGAFKNKSRGSFCDSFCKILPASNASVKASGMWLTYSLNYICPNPIPNPNLNPMKRNSQSTVKPPSSRTQCASTTFPKTWKALLEAQ